MGDYQLSSTRAEVGVLRMGLEDPARFPDILGLGEGAFEKYRGLVAELSAFYTEEHAIPDADTFPVWCRDQELLQQFNAIMRKSVPKPSAFRVHAKMLREMRVGRAMLEVASEIPDVIGKERHTELLQTVTRALTELQISVSERATRSREYYWKEAPDRWNRFEEISSNPEVLAGIPFGIPCLDKHTNGGLHKFKTEADIVAIFGKSGAFKSRLMLNLGWNQAVAGKKVMVISREMARDRIGMLLDSRESLIPDMKGGTARLEYGLLEQAYLSKRKQKRYKDLLLTVYKKRKYPMWIVECPDIITTADIMYEIEMFKSENLEYPDVIYLDYANLIEPVGQYSYESEKYDRIFLELLGICKSFRIPMVTAVRESRIGSLNKERETIDQEHVGLSQAIVYHVHQLWHVDATPEDKAQNRMWIRAKKNRYGPTFEEMLFVAPEFNFIGERDFDAAGDYELE